MSNKIIDLFSGAVINKNTQVLQLYQVVKHICAYNGDYESVVCDISETQFGIQYKVVKLESKKFHIVDNVKPLSQRYGIGAYYDDINPRFLTKEEVEKLVLEATENQRIETEEKEEKKSNEDRLRKIGRERLRQLLPEDIKGLIVAEQRLDKSDTMSDYFGHSTVRTVIIGISMHKRNDFNEMRKCAANFPGTVHLAEKNPDYENRENYTGGGGYYLGENRYSGWIIQKQAYYTRDGLIETYALSAADENNICLSPKQGKEQKKVIASADICGLTLEIVDYSEKSFAIFGDTAPIREKLDSLGGKYNYHLKYGNGKKPGYIFSKKAEQKVRQELNLPE